MAICSLPQNCAIYWYIYRIGILTLSYRNVQEKNEIISEATKYVKFELKMSSRKGKHKIFTEESFCNLLHVTKLFSNSNTSK